MHKPLQQHWIAVKWILRYIAGTLDHDLLLKPVSEFTLEAFCDADWASDLDDRRSSTGYCIYLGGNVVAWKSQKIPTIWFDNQSAALLAANPVLHARTKHIEINLYFVRDKVLQQQIRVNNVPATDQIADCLTKPISSSKFPHLRTKLNVVSQTALSLKEAVKCTDTKVVRDGALFSQENFFGFEFVVRDRDGNLIEAYQACKLGVVKPDIFNSGALSEI
uniref:Uncharacterized protein n=1 Tax=Cannabis sativa TaxID=3483 RepID=A0A803NS71_CANSA